MTIQKMFATVRKGNFHNIWKYTNLAEKWRKEMISFKNMIGEYEIH